MPLVTIEVADTVPEETRFAYAEAVNAGLVEGLGMDAEDRFQVIHPLPASHLVADPHYLGGDRRDVVYVRVLMVRMYDRETKAAMFEAVARRLEAEGVRPDDVFIAITENTLDDWYPGARGERG
ncbi:MULTISPECIES: tautomerase family protein [Rathayibacter]|jgi:phenylpyruvate tautomerase PptA (4-oxalocrotonate tautomerase family)|nr:MULTISPECIES: tautomerase family protein [Rathayibacter]MCJ1671672.1 tautomerase family protein [Rathayibacter sp. VKM Ac-2929]MCJ1684156.1 tautomerase family protein [Rathayibacter sp. VKM Ac-2928]NQX05014.1 tautomerase family protein [Rathayibacter sp. VKM Ac-2858]NQX20182.1 tautomerase family protein [Rathayibacter sp. VKM Ac-2856]QHC61631.1 tautomerase family protein [Rathayibacter festucae]